MLKQILSILETTNKPISLDGLSRQLNVDKSALEGMVQHLIQKGKIVEVQHKPVGHDAAKKRKISSCAGCAENNPCFFIDPTPRMFTLVNADT